jgi:hypothetical protein
MSKTVYAIELDSDYGIVWLDENFQAMDYIHENDRHHEKDFYINLGENGPFKVIQECATDLLNESEYDAMLDSSPDFADQFAEYLAPKLKEKYGNQ